LRYVFKMTHPSASEVRPATILIDLQLQKTPAEEHDASLQELRQLIETLGWDILAQAQTAKPKEELCTISGMVIRRTDSGPLKGAMVQCGMPADDPAIR
jgi:hypothetical protein